jgi:1,2-diacylglycerol 3-alpha-glucosyltransferase
MYEDYVHYITKGHFDRSSKKIVEYLTMFYCDKTAKELIVPSKKTYRLFKEKYEIEKEVRIVPTGIEIERFFNEKFEKEQIEQIRKELHLTKDDFVLLFVGRLAEEKNIQLLLDAQKRFIKENKNIKLVIIGSGPDYEKMLDWNSKHKLEKNIIFTNAIPWEEIPAYYQIADCFATASITETQGLTVIEAMAASKPVICAYDDAFLDVVEDDVNGYTFKTREEYEEIILSLSKDKERLARLSNQARLTSEKHSLKQYAIDILKVYEECIRKPKKKKWFERLKSKLKKEKN